MSKILLPEGVSTMSHTDKRIRRPIDYKKSIEAMEFLRGEMNARELWQKKTDVFIKSTGWVMTTFLGDLHIGNHKTDHARMLHYFELINKTPNVFTIFGGDEVDHAFVFRDGGRADITTEQMQGEICAGALHELDDNGKILAIGQGNHNRFVSNFYETYEDNLKAPLVGPNVGTVNINLNDQHYEVGMFHESSMGNSTMSPLLREQRASEYWFPKADIVAGFHTHRKAIGQYNIGLDDNKQLKTFIEAGTMKPEDEFQRQHGNLRIPQHDFTGAGVLLNPTEHEVIPFYDLDRGVFQLQSLNGLRNILTATTSNILRT